MLYLFTGIISNYFPAAAAAPLAARVNLTAHTTASFALISSRPSIQNGQVFDLESVYKEVVVLEKEQLEDLKKDVVEKFRRAEDSFTEVTGEEQEFLQKFALICLLSFDVYMKKMIVEQLVADLADTMKAQEPEKEAHKKKN